MPGFARVLVVSGVWLGNSYPWATDAAHTFWYATCGLWDWLLWYGCVGVGGRRAPTAVMGVNWFATVPLHDGTGTTGMGGTAPMARHTRHGYATCASTWWRRMRRAHAEDGMRSGVS